MGAAIVLTFQGMQMYVIDSFTLYAASGPFVSTQARDFSACSPYNVLQTALAAVSFFRSIAGFGFPLFAPAMYNALGYGVGNTILAAVAVIVGCPACVSRLTHDA